MNTLEAPAIAKMLRYHRPGHAASSPRASQVAQHKSGHPMARETAIQYSNPGRSRATRGVAPLCVQGCSRQASRPELTGRPYRHPVEHISGRPH
ncbi:hypothetical protein G6F50_018384 [Rhizopus delemar]|uniref:Uncharacterized protein n=1 Tax=Rhizopus delemar TaxID=936053 RepID=A0A9P6XMD9_9FUNG|nr:hypothetical protein G6F50_018384 [Rhizopus delemar]